MAVTIAEETGGTLDATGSGTEDQVWEQTTAGVFQGYIDLSEIQGENKTVTIREYMKIRSGGSYKLINVASYHGVLLDTGGSSEGPALELPVRHVLASTGYKVTLAEDSASPNDYVYSLREIG